MACRTCGGRAKNAPSSGGSVILKKVSAVAYSNITLLKYTGKEKDTFYGVVSGNRYVVEPGDSIEVDSADLQTDHPVRVGMLQNGYFILG